MDEWRKEEIEVMDFDGERGDKLWSVRKIEELMCVVMRRE